MTRAFPKARHPAAVVAAGVVACGAAVSPAAAIDRIAWIEDMGMSPGVPLVALPPTAGAVIGIDEQRKTDSFVQTITFAGDAGTVGENNVVVTITRNNGLAPRISEDTVATEVAKRLPGMALHLGPPDTRNSFGLFGAVFGSRNRLACIYAWQAINLADRWINGDEGTPLDERHGLTIRYRLCRTTATEAELLGDVQASQGRVSGAPTVWRGSGGFDALSSAAGVVPGSMALPATPVYVEPYRPAIAFAREPHVRRLRRAPRPERRQATRDDPAEPPVTARGPDVPLP